MAKRVAVIGSGPGGYPAAVRAASLGAEVTVIERGNIGGVCLNCGCIPSKSLLDAAHKIHTARTIHNLADGHIDITPNWEKISERRRASIHKLQGGVHSLFKSKNVEVITGDASFVSESKLSILTPEGVVELEFDACIIAAGSTAFYPPALEPYKEHLYDNSNIFDLNYLPKTVTIIGGGVIGCEFACMFNALGTEVNIVELMPSILPGEEDGLVRALSTAFTKRGIKMLTGKKAESVEISEGKKIVVLNGGEKIESDEILVAVGRKLNTHSLGLEAAAVPHGPRGIEVNPETLQVKGKENIYAVGDINGLYLLAHAATRQGEVAASNIMGRAEKYNNNIIPRAVYTTPEIAAVGINKKQAEAAGVKVKVGKSFLLANGRAVAQQDTDGFAQIVCDDATGQILGMQLAGNSASELIHAGAVAVQAAMTAEQLKEVVFAHPTFAETIWEACDKLR
ncbi:dihydrolipoamide dehydrogenase [Parelusimicrobium proximum]|uniref:dihydrolipoyl dehydrogenase n=1 Tax=Parelusimicrobium proximum TaxID=3228953 RepID=UPI003D171F41